MAKTSLPVAFVRHHPQLAADGVNLYHGLSNELPLNLSSLLDTRSVVTLHDLIFIQHPEFYPAIDRRLYASKYKRSCQMADAVIAITPDDIRGMAQAIRFLLEHPHEQTERALLGKAYASVRHTRDVVPVYRTVLGQ